MVTTKGAATVRVVARPKAQRIEVCIERANWWKCFGIKIANGVLPDKYRGDELIESAYELVLAQHNKWISRNSPDGSPKSFNACDKNIGDMQFIPGVNDQNPYLAEIFLHGFRFEQKIGVCIQRRTWSRCFSIKIENGQLPAMYHGDDEIEAAYKPVLSYYQKLQRRGFSEYGDGTKQD